MTQPRIEPLTDPPEGEVRELLDQTIVRDGEPLNIFRTLAKHPKLLKRFNLLGGFLLTRGLIEARERELVILRVGYRSRSVYEFGQHTVIGQAVGLTEDEIARLAQPGQEGWDEDDRLLVALCDELCDDDCVGDETWSGLASRFNEAELLELLVLAGFYRLVSGLLNSAGVQLEASTPGWPANV